MRTLFKTLLILLVLLSSSVVLGQTFEPEQTTGLTASASPGGTYVSFGNGTAYLSYGGGDGSGSISGTVSTKYVWTDAGHGTVPLKAIVIESCNSGAHGDDFGGGMPSAAASNGMGTTWSTNSTIGQDIVNSGVTIGFEVTSISNGTRARILPVTKVTLPGLGSRTKSKLNQLCRSNQAHTTALLMVRLITV